MPSRSSRWFVRRSRGSRATRGPRDGPLSAHRLHIACTSLSPRRLSSLRGRPIEEARFLQLEVPVLADLPDAIPLTPLRAAYERVRRLSLAEQLSDCADQLGYPDVLAQDLSTSLEMIRAWRGALESDEAPPSSAELALGGNADSVFYPSREIAVLGAPCSFTCLATGLDPLGAGDTGRDPIDYAAVTCDGERSPVLGAVQSERDPSAYPLLLRGLATLVEMASSERLAALDESVFRGLLGRPPRFDLDLVLFEDWDQNERTAIEQLTRDLAENALALMRSDPSCSGLLRNVVCLRMNPSRADFRLRFGWRV